MTGRPNPEPMVKKRCPSCNFPHHDRRFTVCRECGSLLDATTSSEVGTRP